MIYSEAACLILRLNLPPYQTPGFTPEGVVLNKVPLESVFFFENGRLSLGISSDVFHRPREASNRLWDELFIIFSDFVRNSADWVPVLTPWR